MLLRGSAFLCFCLVFVNSAPTSTSDCEFSCGGEKCVSLGDRCDNVDDCGNGRDEENCDYLYECPKGQFMCRSGECLAANVKCNGQSDCSDGSDEKHCSALPVYTNLPSLHDFEQTEKHVPIRMPATTTPGSRNILKACTPGNSTLYYTTDEQSIYQVLRVSGQFKTRHILNHGDAADAISSLSVDYPNKNLIYVIKRASSQIRFLVDEHVDQVLLKEQTHRFSAVVRDWITGGLYYAEDGVGIGVCTKATGGDEPGLDCLPLINETISITGLKYRDLILHPNRGVMFWIQDDPSGNGVLKISGMDGEKVRTLSGFEHVHAIAFDYEKERLYVAEGDTVDIIDVRSLQRQQFADIKPSALAIYGCDLFYVDRQNNALKKYVDGGQDDDYIATLNGYRFLLAIVGEDATRGHEEIENPCDKMDCDEFCVISESAIESSARCLCVVCEQAETQVSSGSGFIAVLMVLLLLAAFMSLAYVVYKRKWAALNSHIDSFMSTASANDSANISVGYNNSAFKANQELAEQDQTN